MRIARDDPIGIKRASPCPTNFSAPGLSKITRLSARELVANERREGTLALINPVTTSTDGRCVANTKWIPAERANCVMRTTDSSTSRAATIIKSASSSMITSKYGYGSTTRSLPGGAMTFPARTALLKSSICLKPKVERSSYRRSISRTTQVRASAAFLGLVIIGVIKCGIPS